MCSVQRSTSLRKMYGGYFRETCFSKRCKQWRHSVLTDTASPVAPFVPLRSLPLGVNSTLVAFLHFRSLAPVTNKARWWLILQSLSTRRGWAWLGRGWILVCGFYGSYVPLLSLSQYLVLCPFGARVPSSFFTATSVSGLLEDLFVVQESSCPTVWDIIDQKYLQPLPDNLSIAAQYP